MTALSNYPQNNNFLSPLGFKFVIKKLPNVNFFVQSVNIPSVSLGTAVAPTPFANLPFPGDKLSYGTLQLQFRVDENMASYMEVYNWMTGLGHPSSFDQYASLKATNEVTSEASLMILSSAKQPILEVQYFNCFPTSLSDVMFDTKDESVSYVECTATFAYQRFEIRPIV